MSVLAASSGPLAPAWLVLPLAGVALIATAGHVIALREAPPGSLPESRRRIRTATAWVILLTIPLTAYAFGIATPSRGGTYILVWLMVVCLIAAILLLAMLDAFNTLRLYRQESRDIRDRFRALREDPRDDLP